jgi:transketolase
MKPAARIAALSGIQHFFIWTHDSIGVGEDGPTHQPIEHLSQFRALPNFYVWRPADGNENVEAWKTALEMTCSPSAFVASRQGLPLLPSAVKGSAAQGGYLLEVSDDAAVTLMASGSEVGVAMETKAKLAEQGVAANVVSVPCFDLFAEQDQDYIDSVILPSTKKVAIEAAAGMEWYRFADDVIRMESFGASAPAGKLFEKFGFSADAIAARIK